MKQIQFVIKFARLVIGNLKNKEKKNIANLTLNCR